MPRSLLRSRRPDAPSDEARAEPVPPPEPASSPSTDETTARQGATVEVEDDEGQEAGSDLNAGQPGEEEESGPDWRERFASVDEMWEAFRNVDHIRGRHANELGQLRRQAGLFRRVVALLAETGDPYQRATLAHAVALTSTAPGVLDRVEEMVAIGEQALEEEAASVH